MESISAASSSVVANQISMSVLKLQLDSGQAAASKLISSLDPAVGNNLDLRL